MTAPSVRIAARHEHLTRAARSAGEAFACPVQDDAGHGSPTVHRLMWIVAGLILVAAFFTAL